MDVVERDALGVDHLRGQLVLRHRPDGKDRDEGSALLARRANPVDEVGGERPVELRRVVGNGDPEVRVRVLRELRAGEVADASAFDGVAEVDESGKVVASVNGEYGCMGDLGIHALHLPLRAGWLPRNVRAILSDVVTERPGVDGAPVPCDTWDNAVLLCEAEHDGLPFPLRIETKRIAPGETNTWTIEVDGTAGSIAYTTKLPKTLRTMRYESGGPQEWSVRDLGSVSAYPTITGAIFEFGFSDAILQMWAAFLDELAHGREGMRQPFYCATPEEAAVTHRLFTAALESQRAKSVVDV